MVSVFLREHESIERALRRFRKKAERGGLNREIRRRVSFIKPSVERRNKRLRSLYQQRALNKRIG
ncbi:MAG: 30S ribosomal protein S21 [Cytophagales bacterium]|nr:30S ribosomal protein S21 [Cytophagales bacterium]